MDAKTYQKLREQIRAHVDAQNAGLEAVREFAQRVATRISQQHSLQTITCRAGVVRGDEFVPKAFDIEGSTAYFAIQVNFDDRKGGMIFAAAVAFKAQIANGVANIELIDERDWVNRPVGELKNEDAELDLARIVDEQVEAAVNAAIGNIVERTDK